MLEAILETVPLQSAMLIYLLAFMLLVINGLGVPAPEDLIVLTLGYLSYLGHVDLLPSILVAFAGILAGDSMIYIIGRVFGERVLERPFFRRVLTRRRLEKVRHAFHVNGSVYLFFARFTPGLRIVTFWSAGLFKIPYRTFVTLDGAAASISVPVLTLFAYFLGEALEEHLYGMRGTVLLVGAFAILVVVIVTYRHWRKTRTST